MKTALTFNDFTFNPITYKNCLWIRAVELARVLGYSDSRKVSHLYERNADEFTSDMTQVIENTEVTEMGTTNNLINKIRIFSLRGCHLLAMFARTPVAKAFRKWVLDVLDRIAREESESRAASETVVAPELDAIFRALIAAKVAEASVSGSLKRVLHAQAWNAYRRHFGLGKNDQLPRARMSEAIAFLTRLELGGKKKIERDDRERPERIEAPSGDRRRKSIIDDLDRIEKELKSMEPRVRWQLCPTSRDTRDMDFFYTQLRLNDMAVGAIFTARQALAAAGRMREK